MSDSIRERVARIRRLLRGEPEPAPTESQMNDVVLVNLEGDCGLFASSEGTVEIQTRHAGVAVSDDVASVVARFFVVDAEDGVHLVIPRDRFFLADRQLDAETVGGQEYVVPRDDDSLERTFLDGSNRPVPFREVFGVRQVFREVSDDSPHARLIRGLNKILGGS